MSQVTDRTVGANPTGFDMRTELNNIIGALESDNSGSSEPLNPVPYMKWLDTSNATYYYYKYRNHDNTAWVTLFRYTVATKIMEAVSNGVVLSQTDIASEIHASSLKTTPVDNDEMGIWDSVSSTLKKLTWANLKATLKTYFDTLYVTLSGNQTITDIKTFTSSPIAPTQTAGDNSTKVATTAFVKAKSEADSIGVGQTWQNVTDNRSAGVTYTNTTGKPIYVNIHYRSNSSSSFGGILYVDGVIADYCYDVSPGAGVHNANSAIVPDGSTYYTTISGATILTWSELR